MSPSLELVLFENNRAAAARALAAGVDGLIVDLEHAGKERRQEGADTEINAHRPEDLEIGRELGARLRYCRLEGPGRWRAGEVEEVLERGATHLLLPMVKHPAEVELLLARVAGRAAVGILVETVAAVEAASELARLPIYGAFVGLNDLAIERRSKSLFAALADGTVERVREAFADLELGFGGVTAIDRGEPLPARLLLAEMARLGASFSFLRRSFRRDVYGRDPFYEVRRIREAWAALRARGAAEVEADRLALLARLAELC
jgi:hypothetical protein